MRAAIDEGIRDGLEEEIRTRIENEAQVKVEKEMKMNIALDLEEREAESMAMFDKKTDALKNLNSPRKSVKRRRSQLQPYVMDEGEDYEPGSPFKLKRV